MDRLYSEEQLHFQAFSSAKCDLCVAQGVQVLSLSEGSVFPPCAVCTNVHTLPALSKDNLTVAKPD